MPTRDRVRVSMLLPCLLVGVISGVVTGVAMTIGVTIGVGVGIGRATGVGTGDGVPVSPIVGGGILRFLKSSLGRLRLGENLRLLVSVWVTCIRPLVLRRVPW